MASCSSMTRLLENLRTSFELLLRMPHIRHSESHEFVVKIGTKVSFCLPRVASIACCAAAKISPVKILGLVRVAGGAAVFAVLLGAAKKLDSPLVGPAPASATRLL